MIDIREIHEPDMKSNICNDILRALPDWFANEAPIVDYEEKTKYMPFYAAFNVDKAIGFIAIKIHNSYTSEVCVMGVLKDFHRHGIGKMLIEIVEEYCIKSEMEFLTVKTLDESAICGSYEQTRKFYCALGFRPLEVFPLFWDEENPCLFLAKYIGKTTK